MLPAPLQEVLKKEGKETNPNYKWPDEKGETQMQAFDGFKHETKRYERYANFLQACGHDTKDLVDGIERARAAAQELHECGDWYSKQFEEKPFPFMDREGVDCQRVPYETHANASMLTSGQTASVGSATSAVDNSD
jgi:hypothetical protein